MLPSVGLALLALQRGPARHDLAGDRPAVPGQPDRGRQGGRRTSRRTSTPPARPTTSRTSTVEPFTSETPAALDQLATSSRRDLVGAAGRPAAWSTGRSSRCSRCAPTTRSPRCSTSTATRSTAPTGPSCSACASSTRPASTRPTRTGPTCTPSTPTATASSRPTPTSAASRRRRRVDRDRSGPRASRPAQDALSSLDSDGYEDRVYFGEQSPDYSVVGKAGEDADDVELDLGSTAEAPTRRHDRRRTTARAASPVGSALRPADVRGPVRRAQLPALRPRQREHPGALRPRPAASGSRRSRRG